MSCEECPSASVAVRARPRKSNKKGSDRPRQTRQQQPVLLE